jgi:lipopolysaccharide/colanic/teichoic acid biosynthesis glycosyltransferase/NDP-sugar pyrophosphorylase family protein
MKAVILSGSSGTVKFPLVHYYPELILPIANESLVHHFLRVFKNNGITDIGIVADRKGPSLKKMIKIRDEISSGLNISYFRDRHVPGTAGSLKMINQFFGSEDTIVTSPNLFIHENDLADVIAGHVQQRAVMTVAVTKIHKTDDFLENVQVADDGCIRKIHVLHRSRDNRQPLIPTGLYIINPQVLELIPERGYMDIKEQLIPALVERGVKIHVHGMSATPNRIDSLEDYFLVNRDVLQNGFMQKMDRRRANKEILDRVWIGNNVKISSKVNLLGPLVIGDDCVIDDYAQVIGPTCIGRGVRIGKEVLVRESIIWENALLLHKAQVEYSLVGDHACVGEKHKVRNSVILRDRSFADSISSSLLHKNNGAHSPLRIDSLLAIFSSQPWKRKTYQIVKRILDLFLSSFGLVLCLPLFGVIMLAIKLDSRGPVFFSQERCGREGKEFRMFKFRTMVVNAEELKDQLKDRNLVDGPMFKVKHDPRITRVGRLLRRTGLDELPQLLNVLKGEMSLIGPRPLKMSEMAFSPNWRDLRLLVRPGLTGLWQISGQYRISFEKWIEYDMEYIKNQTLWLDLKILLKTVKVVFQKERANL